MASASRRWPGPDQRRDAAATLEMRFDIMFPDIVGAGEPMPYGVKICVRKPMMGKGLNESPLK